MVSWPSRSPRATGTGVPSRSANSGTPRPISSSRVRIVRPGGEAHRGVNGGILPIMGFLPDPEDFHATDPAEVHEAAVRDGRPGMVSGAH